MSNILHFSSKTITTASRRAAQPRVKSYAAVPAHIIQNTLINKRVMELQDDGFSVVRFEGRVVFTHPQISTYMSFSEACATQDRFAREQA